MCVGGGGRERFRFGKMVLLLSFHKDGVIHVLEPLEVLSLCGLPSLGIRVLITVASESSVLLRYLL